MVTDLWIGKYSTVAEEKVGVQGMKERYKPVYDTFAVGLREIHPNHSKTRGQGL